MQTAQISLPIAGPAVTRSSTAVRPSHRKWATGMRKRGTDRTCVCCGLEVPTDALQVVVPSGGRFNGVDYGPGFDRILDPTEPGDDFCGYSICSSCAAHLPAGYALSFDALADALQRYARRPDVLARHQRLFPRLQAA